MAIKKYSNARRMDVRSGDRGFIVAKKSLGQNFLRSKRVVARMADVAEVGADDIVLEIGPGKGVLTEVLLEKAEKVIAIEKDSRLISFLQEKFAKEIKNGKLEIIEADILKFNPEILKTRKYKIVANIPYYITGAFLEHFLSNKIQPSSMTIMVQKEVAERIARSKKESILSISVKAYGEPQFIQKISRGLFTPAPKVDSAILHIGDISKKHFAKISEEKFFEIVKAGFHHKRKILQSNLKKIVTPEAFERCGLPSKSRAEDITLNDWLCLAKCS